VAFPRYAGIRTESQNGVADCEHPDVIRNRQPIRGVADSREETRE
jgi:hypothetical protein